MNQDLTLLESIPEEPTICFTTVLVMPNKEILFMGKTIGFLNDDLTLGEDSQKVTLLK